MIIFQGLQEGVHSRPINRYKNCPKNRNDLKFRNDLWVSTVAGFSWQQGTSNHMTTIVTTLNTNPNCYVLPFFVKFSKKNG